MGFEISDVFVSIPRSLVELNGPHFQRRLPEVLFSRAQENATLAVFD